jgi:hypothetical protein
MGTCISTSLSLSRNKQVTLTNNHSFSQSYDFNKITKIIIKNSCGNVKVTTHNKSNVFISINMLSTTCIYHNEIADIIQFNELNQELKIIPLHVCNNTKYCKCNIELIVPNFSNVEIETKHGNIITSGYFRSIDTLEL